MYYKYVKTTKTCPERPETEDSDTLTSETIKSHIKQTSLTKRIAKEILLYLLCLFAFIFIIYSTTAFIEIEPNPLQWSDARREGVALFFLLGNAGYLLARLYDVSHKED